MPTTSGAKGPGVGGEAHRGLWRPETRRSEEDDDGRRKKRGGARGQAAAERLEVPWPHGLVGEVPAEVTRRLREAGTQRRRAIKAAEQITGGGVEARFR
jgi:hypothetical protein